MRSAVASMHDQSGHALDAACDRRQDLGPFDIIGDVHGCTDELIELLTRLGYRPSIEPGKGSDGVRITPPHGRRAIFVGDLADRGPRCADAIALVMAMVDRGQALCVPGNHDNKLMRWLQGRPVLLTHGLDLTVGELEAAPAAFREQVRAFIEGLPLNLWLDKGDLVVAHAGIEPGMFGRTSGEIRRFCLFGDTDGTDSEGLPIRYHWAARYGGEARIVYGHTPIIAPDWFNNTLCVDTGCCFGGGLTALRWPERDIVTVPARRAYTPQRRPFGHPPLRPLR